MQIGKYGARHGATKAGRHFTKELNKPVNESTVHDMVNAYKKHLKEGPTEGAEALPTAKRERPLIMGDHLDGLW